MRPVLLIAALPVLAADVGRITLNSSLPLSTSTALATILDCTIDASTDACYWVFQMPEDATITTLLINYVSSVGTPVQHRISVQGVNTTNGRYDGTVTAAAAWTPSGGAGVIALPVTHNGAGDSLSGIALSRGVFYSLVIEPCANSTAPCSGAASPNGSNNSVFGIGSTAGQGGTVQGFPYAVINNGGTHTKQSRWPIFGLRSATKTYGNPAVSVTATGISSGDDQAISFHLPSGACSTYKVAGVRFSALSPTAGQSVNVVLYSGTTVLQSVSWDSDIVRLSATTGQVFEVFFDDPAVTLTCGTTYRLGVTPTSTASIGLNVINLPAAGDRTAYPGGTNFGWSTRTGCGGPCDGTTTAWNDDNTKRPLVELILEDITGSGGGGGAFTFIQ
jgi:hypothetical protein